MSEQDEIKPKVTKQLLTFLFAHCSLQASEIERITISVKGSDENLDNLPQVGFKIKGSTKISKVLNSYLERTGKVSKLLMLSPVPNDLVLSPATGCCKREVFLSRRACGAKPGH